MPFDRRQFLIAAGASAVACKADSPTETDPIPLEPAPERDPGPAVFEPSIPEDSAVFPWSVVVGDPTTEGAIVSIYATVDSVEAVLMRFSEGDWTEAARLPGRDTSDYTAVFELTGLDPDTAYAIYAEADGVRSRVTPFRTAPDTERQVRLLATSCLGGASDLANLQFMAREDGDALLLLGDTIYADGNTTLEEYRAYWDQHLSRDYVRDMFASTGVIATWDDHEIDNNWVLGASPNQLWTEIDQQKYDDATQVWRECVPMRLGTSGSQVWRKLSWGPMIDVFVLDCRGERSASQIVSNEQLMWLVDGLQSSEARFKLVLSSIHVCDHFELIGVVQDDDRWQGYPEQRAELITAIKATPGTLVITGDMHYGAVQYVDPAGGLGEDVLEVAAGPAGSTVFPVTDLAQIGGGTVPEQYLTLVETWSFTILDFDPGLGTVNVQFIGDSGDVLGEHLIEGL